MVDASDTGSHPLLALNSKIVSCTFPRGAIIQRGMMMTKTPRTCKIRTKTSTRGKRTVKKMLNKVQKIAMAIVNGVLCQFCKL